MAELAFKVSDLVLLMFDHRFRGQDFEDGVYDVIEDTCTDLRDEQKAHLYAYTVENVKHPIQLTALHDVVMAGLRSMPK